MIFDFRVFIGQNYDGKRLSVPELLGRMDALGIDRALACPFRPLSGDLFQAGREIAAQVKGNADRLAWAARVDPWQPEAASGLRRALETDGACAVYLNPWEENFRIDHEVVDALLEVAAAAKVAVIIAAGYPWVSEALQILSLAKRWPQAAMVMTNGGQINISGLGQADASLALEQCPNLSIDTAGIYRQDFIEDTVAAIGAQKIVFGSGAPYFDQRYEIKRVQLAKVSEGDRAAMLSGNALRLLGL